MKTFKDIIFDYLNKKKNEVIEDAPANAVGTGANVALPPCLLYTSPSPRDGLLSRMPSSA